MPSLKAHNGSSNHVRQKQNPIHQMKPASAVVLGFFILISSVCHALLVKPTPTPLTTGYIQGEVWKQERDGIAKLKCNGFKAELYGSFVIIHVDRTKEPTWTDNYVLTIPWDKLEQLTMLPEGQK